MWCPSSSAVLLSSRRLREEKKDDLEAVIGVLGVFALARRGGGVTCPFEANGSCNAAILLAVGVLRGSRFNGGSRKGWRFFFFAGAGCLCWSASEFEPKGLYWRAFSLSLRAGSRSRSRMEALPERLFVEVLLILLASNGILDFRGL